MKPKQMRWPFESREALPLRPAGNGGPWPGVEDFLGGRRRGPDLALAEALGLDCFFLGEAETLRLRFWDCPEEALAPEEDDP